MTENGKGISVSCANDHVYVRVVGRGTFQNGPPLRRYALDMIKQGRHQFVIDLGGCQAMDSTFLGMLAGIGLHLHRECGRGKVRVIEVNAQNAELLETLGLDRLFEVNTAGHPPAETALPAATDFRQLADTDLAELSRRSDKGEVAGLMLEAHDNLIDVDRRNEEKFEEVTRYLREKIAKCPPPGTEKL